MSHEPATTTQLMVAARWRVARGARSTRVGCVVAVCLSTVAYDAVAEVAVQPASAAPASPPSPPAPAHSLPMMGAPPGSPVSVEATAVALARVLPSTAWGASLGLGLRFQGSRWLRLRAIGTLDRAVSLGGRRPTVALDAGQLDVCEELRFTRLDLSACGGVAGGRWRTGDLGATGSSVRRAWGAAGASLEGQVALTDGLWAMARLDGYVSLVRPSLDVVDPQGSERQTTRASPLGGALGLGARLVF